MMTHKIFLPLLKGTMLNLLLLSAMLISIPTHVHASADDILNEDDLFSDSEMVVETEEMVDDSVTTETDKSSISLTGSIYNHNYYSTVREDYILNNQYMDNDGEYKGSLTSNLLLDMRYRDGIKGFVDSDFFYYFRGISEPGKSDKIIIWRQWFVRHPHKHRISETQNT